MAQATITGEFDDGGKRPRDRAAVRPVALRVARGMSLDITLIIETPDGAPFVLQNTDVLTLTVRRQWGNALVTGFTKTGTRHASFSNVALFEIAPSDTKLLDAGTWTYDVTLVRGSSRDQLVKVAAFVIESAASPA